MSIYERILGLDAIWCKNEQASSERDASEEPFEPTVVVTYITPGFSSLSR